VLLATTGRADLAVNEFKEIVRIDPDSTIGYFNMATALADLDRDVEAAAALREVIRTIPDHYNAHYNLGEMFRLEGKFDEAAKQFKEYVAWRRTPRRPSATCAAPRQYIEQFLGLTGREVREVGHKTRRTKQRFLCTLWCITSCSSWLAFDLALAVVLLRARVDPANGTRSIRAASARLQLSASHPCRTPVVV
jgi:tetratricopeptide (TPR) repeat protein